MKLRKFQNHAFNQIKHFQILLTQTNDLYIPWSIVIHNGAVRAIVAHSVHRATIVVHDVLRVAVAMTVSRIIVRVRIVVRIVRLIVGIIAVIVVIVDVVARTKVVVIVGYSGTQTDPGKEDEYLRKIFTKKIFIHSQLIRKHIRH